MLRDPRIDSADTRKLNWRYSGPYQILEIQDTNAHIVDMSKPKSKGEWIPLDRLSPIPDECILPEGEEGRRRAQLIARWNPATLLCPSRWWSSLFAAVIFLCCFVSTHCSHQH